MFAERNGNVVKVSHTNRKHFTIGDPIAFPIVKMENKNHPKPPFPLARCGPHLIQQCLCPPHTPHQTTAQTVEALSHTDAVKSLLITMARPKFGPESTRFRTPIANSHHVPHPWTRPTYDAKRHPDAIRRFSTMYWADGRTDRPTDRPRESLMTIGRYASNESDVA